MATPTKRPVRRIVPKDRLTDAVEPDEDGDEVPRKPIKKAAAAGESKVRGGWTEGQRTMDSTSSFAQTLKLEEKSVIIKFLDDTPYANFKRHWIERSTKEGKSVRAYTCPTTIQEDCPLCEVGDRAQAVAAFNVALVGDDGQVLIKSWDVGPRLFNVLKAYANDPKVGPLTKGYFIASKTGKRGTVQHNVSPVSRTALREDYDIEIPAQEDFDRLVKYTPEIVDFTPKKTLRELAEELADEYE
jgi:hypothetical protein